MCGRRKQDHVVSRVANATPHAARKGDPWTRSAFLFAARSLPIEERTFFAKSISAASPLEHILLKRLTKK
jgi:hypothetical protein